LEFTVEHIAQIIEGQVHGASSNQFITDVQALTHAQSDHLAFYNPGQNNITPEDLRASKAGVVITTEDFLEDCPQAAIIVEDPRHCFAQVADMFLVKHLPEPGIHPSAVIGVGSIVHPTARIAAGVIIGDHVTIGEHVVLDPQCVIGNHVTIGKNTRIYPHVTIYPKVSIGEEVCINANTVLGADGFGFTPDKQGKWHKVPQLGSVKIADHVDIGAACTVDCGAIEDTVIEEGVKIDDQVHIAHNVHIGAHTIIAGYSAIAGSVTIGKHCMFAGGVRICDNLTITDKVILSAGSAVAKTIREPGMYSSGIGSLKASRWRRVLSRLNNLDTLAKRVKQLEKKCYD
jgi:UDP-3-O-[3-hydroxymyristoyl] glucosamine N-acyltransferase